MKAILILMSLLLVKATTQLNSWEQIQEAFMTAQPLGIIVDYNLCTGESPCPACSSILLNSTNMISPITSISETADKDRIAIVSLQQITTIPEFVSIGSKDNIVTSVSLKQQACQAWVTCPTTATIQVYSQNNKYIYSEVYTCDVGTGLNIFSNLP